MLLYFFTENDLCIKHETIYMIYKIRTSLFGKIKQERKYNLVESIYVSKFRMKIRIMNINTYTYKNILFHRFKC